MSEVARSLVWCEACDLEFSAGDARCPVCEATHQGEPRPVGAIAFLFRNLSDKASPVFRIYPSRDAISRQLFRIFAPISAIALLMCAAGSWMEWKKGTDLKTVAGLFAVMVLVLGAILTLIYLHFKYARPIDVLNDGRMRIPVQGRVPRGALGLMAAAAERASTDSSERNYLFLSSQEWKSAALRPSKNGRNWTFHWSNGGLEFPLRPDHFPALPGQLQVLGKRLSPRDP